MAAGRYRSRRDQTVESVLHRVTDIFQPINGIRVGDLRARSNTFCAEQRHRFDGPMGCV